MFNTFIELQYLCNAYEIINSDKANSKQIQAGIYLYFLFIELSIYNTYNFRYIPALIIAQNGKLTEAFQERNL